MSRSDGLIGAIEAGGTKIVCGLGRTWEEVRAGPRHVIQTGAPDATLDEVAAWFGAVGAARLDAVGVASFGPLDLERGSIAPTPKEGWSGFGWAEAIADRFPGAVLGLDTDTNGAALAEGLWGSGRGREPAVYVTVGTGIGGGLVMGGEPVHGLVHPEVGHMRVPRDPDDAFAGSCPFHGDCLEGLASGTAIRARWGVDGAALPPDHPAWGLESSYLAAAVTNLALIVSPQVIILGGGVMAVPGLLEAVRARALKMLGGYVEADLLRPGLERYLLAPGLGPDSGLLGAFALGRRALGRAG